MLAVSIGTAALADSLAVGGEAVGIRISANGVIVAGTSAVETENGSVSPAEEAGIRKGDVIVKLGGVEVRSAEDFTAAAAALNGDEIKVTVNRDGKQKTLKLTPAKSTDGAYRLGLWLRDGISGVGTLTFYDPETGIYGALGHGISAAERRQHFQCRDRRHKARSAWQARRALRRVGRALCAGRHPHKLRLRHLRRG